jgi:D-glycero-alpha-D-manno-heptose-7-phosphate kinase
MRISFAGGGTDVAPFPEREGGAVLSASITRYAFASALVRENDQVAVRSLDMGLAAEAQINHLSQLDRRLHLLRGVIRRLAVDGLGVDLRVQSQAPPGSGLGASSTIIVAVAGALSEAYGRTVGRHRLAELAHRVEREDLGLPGGTQDHYAAVFGGVNYIEFFGDAVVVNQLRLPPATAATLEHNLILCHLGTSRDSGRIIADQRQRYERGSKATVAALRRQKALAGQLKRELLSGNLNSFGRLLDEAWRVKCELSPYIATRHAQQVYDAALRAGALGGKITGAGGGGHMLIYAPFERRFECAEALRTIGVDVQDVALDELGLFAWSHD